jgi:hypothetical protein
MMSMLYIVNAWLPAATRCLVGELLKRNMVLKSATAIAMTTRRRWRKPRERGLVELPCFKNATKIQLKLQYQGLAFPPQGVFDKFNNLSLSRVRWHGPCNLRNAVSEPWYPCLQNLNVLEYNRLDNLSTHSKSSLKIKLFDIDRSMQHLAIVTPNLKKLGVAYNLLDSAPGVGRCI